MISSFSTSTICVNLHLGQKRGKFLNTPAEQAAGSDGAICESYQDRKGQIKLSTDLS